MDETDRRIDRAIQAYPLAPLPAGFTRRLMRRISPPKPAFRLSMLDLLLPGFFSLFGVGTVAAILLSVPIFDPLWLPRLKLSYQILMVRLAQLPDWLPYFLPVIAVTGVVSLVGLMLVALAPLRSWTRTI